MATRVAGAPVGPDEMKRSALTLAFLALSACSSAPTLGPGVLVLPGSGRTFDQFRFDETDCRGYAQMQLGKSRSEPDSGGSYQTRYDRAFVQCMYGKGHKVPVSGRYSDHIEASPSQATAPRTPPPPPPGKPPAEAPPDFRPK
jgi:hypothetical protein